MRTALETTLAVIVATAVLHNIALQKRQEEPPEDQAVISFYRERGGSGMGQPETAAHPGAATGHAIRRSMIVTNFT